MSPTVVIVFFVFIPNVLPTAESAPLGFGLLGDILDNISCDILNYCDESEEDDSCTDEPDKMEENTENQPVVQPISSTTPAVNSPGTASIDTSTTAATSSSTEAPAL